ncbi:PhoPQ-activated protein PqaA family protein [Paenibacillus filicis]|uniref:PhoPQ-activated protein PqaA family protein n=1 Tax=Paenibacillus gyeongsangnamensis TaxID=3388067 RepID=A0ABT4Q586_9BACL|nr:PhoPQ-activated protein PqaA family protein [Paenibacillus filicis]MCZ8512040.1 PhoPQ-activated protein PqaA family protein [Paenibacillus filicis]
MFEAANQYGDAFKRMGPEDAERIRANWEPSSHLPKAEVPILWVNSTEDAHFDLNIFTKSYRSTAGAAALCIHPGMRHSHAHGWAPREIYTFADSIAQGRPPKKWGPVLGNHQLMVFLRLDSQN